MSRPAVFLDRDGVLNVALHNDYVRQVSQFEWLPGAREAVAKLSAAGFPVVVATNQSGIGRRYYGHADVEEIHAAMRRDLAEAGGRLEGIYVCPHHPDAGCACRKPLPGLLYQAAEELDLDLSRSTFIGDTETDMQAGRAAGCRVLAVTTGLALPDDVKRWKTVPDAVFPSLLEASEWLIAERAEHA